MTKSNIIAISAFALLCTTASLPVYADDPANIVKNGEFFGEVRYRYENVDQDGIENEANANTVRTNLGFKTGEFYGFTGLAEAQIVQNLGDEEFNSLDNGQTAFPVVADPDTAQVNRLWIGFHGIADTEIKVGRQALNIDNQRFIGTVGWRQNDQTFDAGTITNTSIDGLKIQYSYIGNVNRIFEGSTPADDLDSSTHIINASYKIADWMKLTAYGYFMDFSNADALSNETYGIRATGKAAINDDWSFIYEAEYAMQEEYGDNPNDYDENYYHIAPGISGHGFTFKAGYEVLEGDGTNAFQTPLATLHKFNGWADKFLNTPANGLEDLYLFGAYKFSGTDTLLDGTKLMAVYHDFEGNEDGDFGNEFNFDISKSFKLPNAGQPFDSLNVKLRYADYEAEDSPYTDTQKFWLQLGVKF